MPIHGNPPIRLLGKGNRKSQGPRYVTWYQNTTAIQGFKVSAKSNCSTIVIGDLFWIYYGMYRGSTLQEINISHLGKRKIIFKMDFSGDMLVPRRVVEKHWLNQPLWKICASQEQVRIFPNFRDAKFQKCHLSCHHLVNRWASSGFFC